MYLDVTGSNLQGSSKNVRLASIPDICPICHHSIYPKHITTQDLAERSLAQSVFRCTREKCQEIFIATYRSTNKNIGGRIVYEFVRVAPISPNESDFPDTIKDLSPSFVEIYNQALAAESYNLSQLVGIGLRKALEFLIKDFAVKQHPEEESEIRASMLGKCINDYVNDINVKECAKRAAWLGNDETHYTRRWEDKDVKDLKLLVRLTVNWIDNILLTQKYIQEMDGS